MEGFIYYAGLYIFYYPLIMSLMWIVGGVYFFLRHELYKTQEPPVLEYYPTVDVFIPARNEEQDIAETVRAVLATGYPKLEVILINDASTDHTLKIMLELAQEYPQLRILNLEKNLGKANGLNLAFAISKGEIILTIDADALLDKDAITWAVWHFNNSPRVGALTGNPRVRNRTTLLAKIQTAEYSSIIGLIKRTQRLIGKIMTVSGVVAFWRRAAVASSGLWSKEMATDDIAMTWNLERRFWDVRYEPNVLCWMLVPERLSGLWRQRCRWAQGGVEVVRRHYDIFFDIKQRRLWPVYIDYVLGIFWAHLFLAAVCFWVFAQIFMPNHALAQVGNIFLNWNGSLIALVCLLQFGISIILDYRYDQGLFKIYFWCIWYPVVYWVFNSLAVVRTTAVGVLKKMDQRAIWTSPDRGMR